MRLARWYIRDFYVQEGVVHSLGGVDPDALGSRQQREQLCGICREGLGQRMTNHSDELRKRAADNRDDAENEPLANAKARLLLSANRLDELADQAERVQVLKLARS